MNHVLVHKERNRVAYQPLEQGKTCDVHGWGLRVSSTKVESSFPPAMYPVLSQLRRWCHLDAECRVMLDNYDIRWVLPFLFLDIQIQIKTHIQIGKHIMRDNCDIRCVLLCWQTNCCWELSLTREVMNKCFTLTEVFNTQPNKVYLIIITLKSNL